MKSKKNIKKKNNRKKKNKPGFTLIELLAVIIILGVIMLIAIPSVTKLMSYSNNSYNGLMMLLMQAAKSEDIWLDKKYDLDYKKIYNEIKKVIDNE